MIESGRIDHAHHENQAVRAMSETIQLDETLEAVLDMMKDHMDETLIIVTADHAHTMSISGYNARGNDIRGKQVRRRLLLETGLPSPKSCGLDLLEKSARDIGINGQLWQDLAKSS